MNKKYFKNSFLFITVLFLFVYTNVSAASLVTPEIVSFGKTAEEENALTVNFKSGNTGTYFGYELLNKELETTTNLGGAVTSYTFQNLEEDGEYSVTIRACTKDEKNYVCSNWTEVKTASIGEDDTEDEDGLDDDILDETTDTTAPTFKSAKLSTTSYTYNGKNKTPSVTVKNSNDTTLTKGTHYTVSYPASRKNIGTYTVTVKGKGGYSFTKALTFKIIPPKTSISSASATKNTITVKWKKVSGGVKYQIGYKKASAKNYKYSTTTSTSKKIKSLSKKTKYKYVVRSYKKVGSKTYYSSWTSAKAITTKSK